MTNMEQWCPSLDPCWGYQSRTSNPRQCASPSVRVSDKAPGWRGWDVRGSNPSPIGWKLLQSTLFIPHIWITRPQVQGAAHAGCCPCGHGGKRKRTRHREGGCGCSSIFNRSGWHFLNKLEAWTCKGLGKERSFGAAGTAVEVPWSRNGLPVVLDGWCQRHQTEMSGKTEAGKGWTADSGFPGRAEGEGKLGKDRGREGRGLSAGWQGCTGCRAENAPNGAGAAEGQGGGCCTCSRDSWWHRWRRGAAPQTLGARGMR